MKSIFTLKQNLFRVGMLIGMLFVSTNLFAIDYYIDPVNGDNNNSGSLESPWQSLQYLFNNDMIESQVWNPRTSAFEPRNSGALIKGGDAIYLMSGEYGKLDIFRYYNNGNITIVAAPDHTPRFSNIRVYASSNWVLDGLHVSERYGTETRCDTRPNRGSPAMVCIERHSFWGPTFAITLQNSTISSVADTQGWSQEDWRTRVRNGIELSSTENISLLNNTLTNVATGITARSTGSLIQGNIIDRFSGDGIRLVQTDETTVDGNVIKNAFLGINTTGPGAFHYDGIQLWSVNESNRVSVTGPMENVTIKNNTIIAYEDGNEPSLVRSSFQGIGMFDGIATNFLVENNTVVVTNPHGITLSPARDSIIRNNLIVDIDTTDSYDSPLRIIPNPKPRLNNFEPFTDLPSIDVEITCNIASRFVLNGEELTSLNNQTLNLSNDWRNPAAFKHADCDTVPGAPLMVSTIPTIDLSHTVKYNTSSEQPIDIGAEPNLLNISGNHWIAVPHDYLITENTVLEFDFNSQLEGEMHSIGLDNNLGGSGERTFQIFGTEIWGIQHFHNYTESDSVKTYRIPIGEFYQGQSHYIFFVMDNDANPNSSANAAFSNVRIYENMQ